MKIYRFKETERYQTMSLLKENATFWQDWWVRCGFKSNRVVQLSNNLFPTPPVPAENILFFTMHAKVEVRHKRSLTKTIFSD